MDEKGKSYWRPPEVPKLVPPMPDFDDFPISAWLKTPPILPKDYHRTRKTIRLRLFRQMSGGTEYE